MRPLPVPDPGRPDHRSAGRYLLWLAGTQRRTMALGAAFGILWMVSQALMPATIGRAIDAGIAGRDPAALLRWAGVLLLLAAAQAVAGVLRHRCAVINFLSAAYRTVQLVVRQANRLGDTLGKRVATGEVVSIGTADISHIGNALDITARAAGSAASIVVVAIILLRVSVPLGLVVILGAPLFTAVAGLLIRPLHQRQQEYRDQQAQLSTRAADIVTGLRVLRGIGGERTFADRYAGESQRLRVAGVRVGRVESYLSAAEVLVPGVFVVVVTWLGARFVLAGALTAGQLVALYGYATFLVLPLRTITEAFDKMTKGHVAARRLCRLLDLTPDLVDPAVPRPAPSTAGDLVDPESGLVVPPGRITALAAAEPADAVAVAARLARYEAGPVTLSGVPLAELELATVRRLILLADNDARLFSGPLRAELDPRGSATDADLLAALRTASATDIVEALPAGLDSLVAERGREFSGGQQQRLRLARALLADPPILVLIEPTSAVDAHTEARIAAGLGPARAGRTTVLTSTSPLVLDRADLVCFLIDGKVVAQGTHRELLTAEPRYAETVTRGED